MVDYVLWRLFQIFFVPKLYRHCIEPQRGKILIVEKYRYLFSKKAT